MGAEAFSQDLFCDIIKHRIKVIGEAAMRFTEEQRAAIDSRGENLLIAAAAGSGKTTVMIC